MKKLRFAALERISRFPRRAPASHWGQMESVKHREGGWLHPLCRGWLTHGHVSCSTPFSRQFDFMTHLLFTSTTSKACREVMESQCPRGAVGGPQGGQEPSKVSPCRGELVHPAPWCLSLSGSWQEKQGDFQRKIKMVQGACGKGNKR